ncbi:MAG: DUF4280 domain-containing protein [Firmicutes bacterium]|jgi:hypothetical protein|nr:DUF4280 domain-containing protein [Bacillota bacterium]
MGVLVCAGAVMSCSFGMAPSVLDVLPDTGVVCPTPAATIMDFVPMLNIMPFGMCISEANPEVIAATAAALGVLTPMPCIPVTVAPWVPGAPTVLLAGQPALDDLSTCMCAWGGVITIEDPGQFQTTVE